MFNYFYRTLFVATLILFLSAEAKADIIGHWKLDETTGTTAADSVNGNDGIYAASDDPEPGWQTGLIGGAAGLSDEDDNIAEYFSVASIPQMANAEQLSISIWFNQNDGLNTNATNQGLFRTNGLGTMATTGGRTGGLNVEGGPIIDARMRSGSEHAADSEVFSDGPGWHHALLTWDSTEELGGPGTGALRVYVDGELSGSESTTGLAETLPALSGVWEIGNDGCCGARGWTGALDDLAVWDEQLAPEVVSSIYFDGLFGIDAATSYTEATAELTSGDVTGDDLVTSADFDVIKQNFRQPLGLRTEGDLVNNNFVDLDDYLQWLRASKNPESLVAGSQSVPEPSTLVLLFAVAFLCRGRFRG